MAGIAAWDISFRSGVVRGGDWTGYALAWKGRMDVEGLPGRPYLSFYPWYLDPAWPEDPTLGHAGKREWELDLLMVQGLTDVAGYLDAGGVDGGLLLKYLEQYRDAGTIDMMDEARAIMYTGRIVGFELRMVEGYGYGSGGSPAYVGHVRFVLV